MAAALPSTAPGLDWVAGFGDLPREHGFEPLRVEGELPAGLAGTLYRAGPMLSSLAGQTYAHWFDGDGGVCAVRFRAGTAEGAVRLVQSKGLLRERAAGRRLYSTYGTPPKTFREVLLKERKNAANTALMAWQRRLYALYEPALPTELASDSLETLGESDLDGVLRRAFSAHPHFVAARGAAYNFSVEYGRRCQLVLFELPSEGRARRLGAIPLPFATLVHDFAATDRHLVFFISPVRLSVLPLAFGTRGVADCLRWTPEDGTRVWVVPIDDPGRTIEFSAEPFFQWHFANAFQRGTEIVVDFVPDDHFETHDMLRGVRLGQSRTSPGRLARAVIDVAARRLRVDRMALSCDFPKVAPDQQGAPHRYLYASGYGVDVPAHGLWFDSILKVDVDSGRVARHCFSKAYPSETLFVRRAGATSEDDGHLLSLVYDAAQDTSYLAVLDACAIESGPVARAWFPERIPFTFHGAFVPAG